MPISVEMRALTPRDRELLRYGVLTNATWHAGPGYTVADLA